MAVDTDGAIAADAGIITGGVEVGATTMVGGIIVITGDLTSISSEKPLQLAASRVGSRNQCRLLARESVRSLPLLRINGLGWDATRSLKMLLNRH